MDIGELGSGLTDGVLLQEADADDDAGAVVDGLLHGVVTVGVSGLAAVGGLIVLVAQVILVGVGLDAVPGALVEGLVLEIAHVGDEGDFIGVGLHGVGDVVGVDGFVAVVGSGGISLGRARIGGSRGVGGDRVVSSAAGGEGEHHHEREKQCKKLLHLCKYPPFHNMIRVLLAA